MLSYTPRFLQETEGWHGGPARTCSHHPRALSVSEYTQSEACTALTNGECACSRGGGDAIITLRAVLPDARTHGVRSTVSESEGTGPVFHRAFIPEEVPQKGRAGARARITTAPISRPFTHREHRGAANG